MRATCSAAPRRRRCARRSRSTGRGSAPDRSKGHTGRQTTCLGGILLAPTNARPALTMDLAKWLLDLGLERYAQEFLDNDVDAQILVKLTETDLIAIGIKSVGHRRRLLDAIAQLRGALSEEAIAR